MGYEIAERQRRNQEAVAERFSVWASVQQRDQEGGHYTTPAYPLDSGQLCGDGQEFEELAARGVGTAFGIDNERRKGDTATEMVAFLYDVGRVIEAPGGLFCEMEFPSHLQRAKEILSSGWGWLMPLYLLSCKKCEKLWELLIRLEDFEKGIECPECGEKLKRLVTPVLFKVN